MRGLLARGRWPSAPPPRAESRRPSAARPARPGQPGRATPKASEWLVRGAEHGAPDRPSSQRWKAKVRTWPLPRGGWAAHVLRAHGASTSRRGEYLRALYAVVEREQAPSIASPVGTFGMLLASI